MCQGTLDFFNKDCKRSPAQKIQLSEVYGSWIFMIQKPPAAYSSSSSCCASSYLPRITVWILSLVSELIGCAISLYSPSEVFLLGIAINSPFSPSITLISWTTNSSSNVTEATALSLPSFVTFFIRTSVICISSAPFLLYCVSPICFLCKYSAVPHAPHSYNAYLSFFSTTTFTPASPT